MNTVMQSLPFNESALQMEFIELLFKEKLINKETYYNAKNLLKEEASNGDSKQIYQKAVEYNVKERHYERVIL